MMSFVRDFGILSDVKDWTPRSPVNLLTWIPIDIDFGNFTWTPVAPTNLGFRFNTSSGSVFDLVKIYKISFQPLPAGPLVVKCLSRLLHASCSNDMDAIQSILTKENHAILLEENHRLSAIQVYIEKIFAKVKEMAKKGKERAKKNDMERMERQNQDLKIFENPSATSKGFDVPSTFF